MKYDFGRSPCHYLPSVLDRLRDLNRSIINPHERALLARANMLAYELTDNKQFDIKARALGKEILHDVLTKESYKPEEEEIKILYFLHKENALRIDEAQIQRLLSLQENWNDPDDRLAALLIGYTISLGKGEIKEQIFKLLEELPREEKLWPYATAYVMSNREFEFPPDILELAKEVSGEADPGKYLDRVIWIKSLYDPDFGPRNFEARKKLARDIMECDKPLDLLFVLGFMRNENVFENIQRNITEIEPSLEFNPTINRQIEARSAPTEDAIILGRGKGTIKEIGCQGTMYLGRISEKGNHELYGKKVLVDAVFPHVIFISGHRGSGKSYTLGVIAEELSQAKLGVGTILVDPIGIFWALKNENTDDNESLLLERWGLSPETLENIEVFTPVGIYDDFSDQTIDSPFALKPSDLEIEDWCRTFDIGRYEVRGTVLEKALKIIEDQNIEDFSIDDIIHALDDPSIVNNFHTNSIRAIRSRMNAAKGWGIFDQEGTPLRRLSSPNKISVLDISNPRIGESLRALLVGIIARKILEARIRSSRGELFEETGESEEGIPVTWLMIDEAHVLVPNQKKTAASDPLIEYAKQGRKPGCALVLVTQQPSAMHNDIMSQIDIMITHLLTFEDDIRAFLRRVPARVPEEFEESDFIRSMPTGVGLFSDQRTQNRSMIVKVRPRVTLHAGREAVPKSIREKINSKSGAVVHTLDKRDVLIEETQAIKAQIQEEMEETSEVESKPLIPEPVPESEPKQKDIEATKEQQATVSHEFPVPEPCPFPKQMILSILERKLEYGQNDFLYSGSKSRSFDQHQKSSMVKKLPQELIPPIVNQLKKIGWKVEEIIEEQATVIILMRLETAGLGISYANLGNATAISYLIVAKERFKKSTYDKIFGF
jgi:hypothetical protein